MTVCPDIIRINTQDLNENVAAGQVVNNPSVKLSFPEDDSKASQLARINAAIVTLQNLNGKGKGCQVASTTFLAQEAAINDAGTQPALLARQTDAVTIIDTRAGRRPSTPAWLYRRPEPKW
jgi:hypothetical protein